MGCGSSTADNSASSESEPQPRPTSTEPEVTPNTSEQFMEDAIASHNKYRAMHGAPPMQPADDLIEYAQKYAQELAKRDVMEHSKCTLPSGVRIGENLYYYWSSDKSASASAEMAVSSWYDEIKDYNFNSSGFSGATGHFTQVVWKESTELGMAWAKTSKGTTYVVASYRPAGNMLGDFDQNGFMLRNRPWHDEETCWNNWENDVFDEGYGDSRYITGVKAARSQKIPEIML